MWASSKWTSDADNKFVSLEVSCLRFAAAIFRGACILAAAVAFLARHDPRELQLSITYPSPPSQPAPTGSTPASSRPEPQHYCTVEIDQP